MDLTTTRFAAVTRRVSGIPSRRAALRGMVGSLVGLAWAFRAATADAKKRKKRKKRKKKHGPKGTGTLCARNGQACNKAGKTCQERFCLRAPFTIEATWTDAASAHDTFLFVPPGDGMTEPSPYINFACNRANSACEEAYPFACVSRDAAGPGNETTTIYRTLRGRYEYWIEIYESTPANELTVTLKDRGGRVVRQWPNPGNATEGDVGWHVFDVDADGRVTSIEDLIAVNLPIGAHNPNSNVCPDEPTTAAAISTAERHRLSTRR